jgi:hypothetical protein
MSEYFRTEGIRRILLKLGTFIIVLLKDYNNKLIILRF